MNLCHEKQLFLCNFIHNTGIKFYLQWRASALECFPIQPTIPFLPLSGVYLYYSSVEITKLKIVTSHYHALTIQGEELSPHFTNKSINIMALVVPFGMSNSLTCLSAMADYEYDAPFFARSVCFHRVQM